MKATSHLPDQEHYRVSPIEAHSLIAVAFDASPQNLEPASREVSTTREPRETEWQSSILRSREVSTTREPREAEWQSSILRSARKDSRPKLTTRNPALLKSSSMSNVMTTASKQPKPTSQRRLHDVSDSKLLRRCSNNGRASSTRNLLKTSSRRSLAVEKKQTSERTLLKASRQSPEVKCVDDKPGTKVQLQGFLEDDNRNRVKSHIVEAADATSTTAISGLSMHTRRASTTAHATRRPTLMPRKTSSQRSIVQNRKSDPHSGDVTLTPARVMSSKVKRPSYKTSKSEGVLRGMPLCPFPSTAATKKRSSKKENESLHSDLSGYTWDCESFATDESFPITSEGFLGVMPFCLYPSPAATKTISSKNENESLYSDASGCTWDCESFATDDESFFPMTKVFPALDQPRIPTSVSKTRLLVTA
jgi:hypothetical protein